MIPVNDAIVTSVVSTILVALITLWACRGFWKSKVDDAHQDGHAAGIQTQIARHARAERRARYDPDGPVAAERFWHRALSEPEPVTEMIVADVTTARHARTRQDPPGVIPFPEGLPDGLREYATQALAAARALPPPGSPR